MCQRFRIRSVLIGAALALSLGFGGISFGGIVNPSGSTGGGGGATGVFQTQVFTTTNASFSCPASATYVDWYVVGGAGGGAGGSNAAAGSGGGGSAGAEVLMLCSNGPFNVQIGPGGAGGGVGVGAACSNGVSGTASSVTDSASNSCTSAGGVGAPGASTGCTTGGNAGGSTITLISAPNASGIGPLQRISALGPSTGSAAVTTTPGTGGLGAAIGGKGGGVSAVALQGGNGYVIANFF